MSPQDRELIAAVTRPRAVPPAPTVNWRAIRTLAFVVAIWAMTIVLIRQAVRIAQLLGWLS